MEVNEFRRPARLGNDHFGAELMKLVPEFFQFKMALDTSETAVGRDDVTAECRRHVRGGCDVRHGICS